MGHEPCQTGVSVFERLFLGLTSAVLIASFVLNEHQLIPARVPAFMQSCAMTIFSFSDKNKGNH